MRCTLSFNAFLRLNLTCGNTYRTHVGLKKSRAREGNPWKPCTIKFSPKRDGEGCAIREIGESRTTRGYDVPLQSTTSAGEHKRGWKAEQTSQEACCSKTVNAYMARSLRVWITNRAPGDSEYQADLRPGNQDPSRWMTQGSSWRNLRAWDGWMPIMVVIIIIIIIINPLLSQISMLRQTSARSWAKKRVNIAPIPSWYKIRTEQLSLQTRPWMRNMSGFEEKQRPNHCNAYARPGIWALVLHISLYTICNDARTLSLISFTVGMLHYVGD